MPEVGDFFKDITYKKEKTQSCLCQMKGGFQSVLS